MSKQIYSIDDKTLEKITEQYRQGISLTKLQAEYGIPYHILQNRLYKVRINVSDIKAHNASLIVRAERKLIGGSFPNYTFNFVINTLNDYKKYRSLRFAFAHSDLNGDHMLINELLLA